MITHVGISLGSNLGHRLAHLKVARDMLLKLMPDDAHHKQSSVYQSAPLHCPPDSPDFFNTVLEIGYMGRPHELLGHTRGIEFYLGRDITYQANAPRIIDVDILYFGIETIRSGILTIPHPRLTHRRFVLQPLADIHPDFILPGDTTTIAGHLHHLDSGEPPITLVQSDW